MDLKNRYKKYSKEVLEQIELIVAGQDLDDSYLVSLDMLAINYSILFKSLESINEEGLSKKDIKDRTSKNYAIQTLNSAQTNIIKLLSHFPTSPLSKARLHKLNNSDVEQEPCPIDEFLK